MVRRPAPRAQVFEGGFTWRLTWKDTYVASIQRRAGGGEQGAAVDADDAQPRAKEGRAAKRARTQRGKGGQRAQQQHVEEKEDTETLAARVRRAVRVRHFYSDLLYQPWHCATLELPQEWLEVDNVPRCANTTRPTRLLARPSQRLTGLCADGRRRRAACACGRVRPQAGGADLAAVSRGVRGARRARGADGRRGALARAEQMDHGVPAADLWGQARHRR